MATTPNLPLAMASYLERASRFYARRRRRPQADRYSAAAQRWRARALFVAIRGVRS